MSAVSACSRFELFVNVWLLWYGFIDGIVDAPSGSEFGFVWTNDASNAVGNANGKEDYTHSTDLV